MKMYKIACGDYALELGGRTCVMGILNVTPDSFSDGGRFFTCDTAVAHAEKMVEDGADIIDIGGESTRPFSEPVSEEDEIRRVLPVIEKLAKRISVPISIDTTKSGVAKKAIDAGASIINDIGSLRLDPDMPSVVTRYGVPVILMHMKGTPKNMQIEPVYDDLISDIKAFLSDAIDSAEANGIPRTSIIIDPGIGFGKTATHNLMLIKHLAEFGSLNVPVLIGPSRKAFIRNILKGGKDEDIQPESPVVETGTQAAVSTAVLNGAHIVRVHDVAATRATLNIIDAIKNCESA